MRHSQGISLTYTLVEKMGQAIVAGTYEGRGFPTESELCAAHGASRTVTREAVKMLTAKGLLSSRPRQGTRVEPVAQWNLFDPDVIRWMTDRPYSHKIYRDLSEVRLAIEPVAAGLAARRATRNDIRAMRAGLNGMRDDAADHDLALLADVDFHVAILQASGNPFFHQLRELIHTALSLSIALTNRIAGHTASLPAHEAVLAAIEQGRAQEAERAMRMIIQDSLGLVDTFKATDQGVGV